jgi:hypothetical protein
MALKKFNYMTEAINATPQAILHIFSLLDRESFEELTEEVLASPDSLTSGGWFG